MNKDEVKSNITHFAGIVLAYAAGRYHLSQETVGLVMSDVGYAGSAAAFLYGLYAHWNMKKVAETAKVVASLFAIAFVVNLLLTPIAIAGDMSTKAKPVAANSLPGLTNCGFAYGINTIGNAGAVNGGTPGATIIQGAIGGTIGYGCSIGNTPGLFVFVEGNFDWANLNGSTSGLSLTGPAHFEQRFGLGSPLAQLVPSFFNFNATLPSDPLLPAGVTAGPSYPFFFFSLHEQDIGSQVGVAQNREWLFSPGFGIGLETVWSNGIIVEPAVQYVLQSSGMAVGPTTVKLGNAVEASVTLKYPFKSF